MIFSVRYREESNEKKSGDLRQLSNISMYVFLATNRDTQKAVLEGALAPFSIHVSGILSSLNAP